MFNFYIDGLIEELHNMIKQNLPSCCLFFADDGNLHGTKKEQMQKLLDGCNHWSTNYGIKFAPGKCLVVAGEKTDLFLGQLPQVESAKYLGIPFTRKGADWKKVVSEATKKAKGVIST